MFISSKQSTAPVFRLPNELLAEVASYCTIHHPHDGHIIDIRGIAALSLVSRRMRVNALPYLFEHVIVTSERKFNSLAVVPSHLLGFIQTLNVFLDHDFFAAWKTFAARPPTLSSPYALLGRVLSQAPSLQALRILVAESTGERSPWSRSFFNRPDGIPAGSVLKSALANVRKLGQLKTIHLDALSDVAPLLHVAPNLEDLRMRLPSGYAQYTNREFVAALQYVPNLRRLTYSAESLRINLSQGNVLIDAQGMGMDRRDEDESVELIFSIGKLLPRLELLDLQSRWYGDEILFPPCEEYISSEGFIRAMHHLPNLTHIALPTTTSSSINYSAIRSDNESLAQQAIDHCAITERLTVLRLGTIAHNIRSIFFIRPESASSAIESTIEYKVHVTPDHKLNIGHDVPQIPPQVAIAQSSFHDAIYGQMDALPPVEHTSSSSARSWQTSALSYVKENHVAAAFAAGASGVLIREASRVLYMHIQAVVM